MICDRLVRRILLMHYLTSKANILTHGSFYQCIIWDVVQGARRAEAEMYAVCF